MRDRRIYRFATPEEATAWKRSPERRLTSEYHDGALEEVDELLAPHGLEVVLEWFQSDAWFVIEPRVPS
ncbi:hypothetical protein [Lichenibacterium dinghuense]|uniref:hypothetical protein n=1 Tax=Lichenibacterium dinghuense TaxID=2895977 RepID=UPI001F342215|nr:hypothetical protein [Lichenibacterium sp. 6Y81]